MEVETEADSTDKSHPFEIETEDITEHDDKPIPYLCTVCDKQFKTKGDLDAHTRIHETMYSYSECEESALSLNKNIPYLNRRSRIRDDTDMYSCRKCDKRFPSQSALCSHKNTHTGKYKCAECGKCCYSSTDLAAHIRRHSGEKPFECSVCNKRFTMAGNLVVHSRIHSGQKPYKCHMCDKAFSESGHLNLSLIHI